MIRTITLADDAEVDDVVDWAHDLEAFATSAGAPIDYLGLAPLFTAIRGYRTESALWVLSRAEDDPLMAGGKLPMPDAERRKLLKLLDAGLDFPHMYIAHVRHATIGGTPKHADTHPFARELDSRFYCFAHNGTIRKASERLLLERYQPIGDTDSEAR